MKRPTMCLGVALATACSPDPGREDSATTSTTSTSSAGTDATTSGTGTPTSTGTTGTTEPAGSSSSTGNGSSGGPIFDLGALPDVPDVGPLPLPQLWYSLEDLLVYVEIDPADGSVAQVVTSTIINDPPLLSDQVDVVEFSSLTMLADGSLLGARGTEGRTQLYHVAQPPTVASDIEVTVLGDMPDQIYVEALYTDCDGRVYLMDTGVDSVSNVGNRLIRFTGDYLAGDFTFEVITDLMVAVAADIDDMAPGIDDQGAVVDNPGFAIDSETVYAFDYTTGTGTALGTAGTYGIHALGGPLFDDGVSRLYVLDIDAQIFAVDPVTLALSPVLATGPALPGGGVPGLAGITGPLTDCMTGFPQG